MKNRNGFVLSTYVYILLVFFLLLLSTALAILNNTRLLSNKLKEQTNDYLNNGDFNFLLLGDLEYKIYKGDEFTEPGFMASTVDGKSLADFVRVSGAVDVERIGTYQLTYTLKYSGVSKVLTRKVDIVPIPFEVDSWETIKNTVLYGDPSIYRVGDTKVVKMADPFGSHIVRVANNSYYDCINDVGVELSSKTACGFVIEFADIISIHNINSTLTGVGGWKDSEMRTYVNSDIFNSLPTDLQNVIVETTAVSGYSVDGESNFVTQDKLYLLASREVYGKVSNADTASGDTITRQLDYYVGYSSGNIDKLVKTYQGSSNYAWWLRSPLVIDGSAIAAYFNSVKNRTTTTTADVTTGLGVSPAFKLNN